MDTYQQTTGYWPAQHSDQYLVTESIIESHRHFPTIRAAGHDRRAAEGQQPEPIAPPPLPHHAAPSPRGRATRAILIVDDEEPVRETLAEVLGFYGYRVITVANVEEAEEAKQRVGVEGIQLVVADIHLTAVPLARAGYVLAQHWRSLHPGLPFILISGDSRNEDLPDIRAGVVRFLLKPFGTDVFIEAVQQAVGT